MGDFIRIGAAIALPDLIYNRQLVSP
jgi:hypothetical protein